MMIWLFLTLRWIPQYVNFKKLEKKVQNTRNFFYFAFSCKNHIIFEFLVEFYPYTNISMQAGRFLNGSKMPLKSWLILGQIFFWLKISPISLIWSLKIMWATYFMSIYATKVISASENKRGASIFTYLSLF